MKYQIKFLKTDGSPLGAGIVIELLGDDKSIGCAKVDAQGIAAFELDGAHDQKLVVRVPQQNMLPASS